MAVADVAHVVCWLPLLSVPDQHVPPVPSAEAVAEVPWTAKVMVPLGALAPTCQAIVMSVSPVAVTVMSAVSVYDWGGIPSGDVMVAVEDHVAWYWPAKADAAESGAPSGAVIDDDSSRPEPAGSLLPEELPPQ